MAQERSTRDGNVRRRPSAAPTREEIGRRVRAAWAYSGLRVPEFADAAGISEATYGRLAMTRSPNAGTEIPWSTLWRIADAAGLPRNWFSTPSIPTAIEAAGGPRDLPLFFSPPPGEPAAETHAQAIEDASQLPSEPTTRSAEVPRDEPAKRRRAQGR